MEANITSGGRIRSRVTPLKILTSSLCIGSGGSVGREGPIAQIGASIGSSLGQIFKLREESLRTLVLCGAGGGIAATFNAPIAGALFASEVLQRQIFAPNFIFILLSSITADIIARIFLFTPEHPTSFVIPEYSFASFQEFPIYIALGVIASILAIGFIRFFFQTDYLFSKLQIPSYLKPVIGGVGIGLIGLFLPEIFGVGYGTHYGVGGVLLETGGVDKALMGEIGLGILIALIFAKMVATSLTLGSGGSGGIFAPSLFTGAMIGGAFGKMIHSLLPAATASSGAYALVGMGTFFAVAVRGPLTAIIILFEMTHDYEMLLPLGTAIAVGFLVARGFSRESIYTTRLRKWGIEPRPMGERDVMRAIPVSQAMTHDFPSVSLRTPVNDVLQMMEEMGHHGFPVLDEQGRFRGIVTLEDVHNATRKKDVNIVYLTVNDIAAKSPFVAYPDQTLYQVITRLGGRDYGRIPVVDRNDCTKLLGCLRRHDIIRAYFKEVSRR